MKRKNDSDLLERIKEALQISSKLMVEKKKKLGQKLVISENGVVKIIDP